MTSDRNQSGASIGSPNASSLQDRDLQINTLAEHVQCIRTLTKRAIGDVIEMFTSGVPEGQIVDIIQHSQVQFDALDKDTAIAIARARLPLTLQNELRKKVGAALLGPAKAATGK